MRTDRLDLQKLLGEATGEWLGAPAGTRIGHVHLRVGDVAQAADFYTGVIGMDITRQRGGAVFLSSGGYHHHLAANVWESPGAGPRDPNMAGLVEVVLEATDPAKSRLAADPWGTRIAIQA
jgi:catechol 2,3-dioxygenase